MGHIRATGACNLNGNASNYSKNKKHSFESKQIIMYEFDVEQNRLFVSTVATL